MQSNDNIHILLLKIIFAFDIIFLKVNFFVVCRVTYCVSRQLSNFINFLGFKTIFEAHVIHGFRLRLNQLHKFSTLKQECWGQTAAAAAADVETIGGR